MIHTLVGLLLSAGCVVGETADKDGRDAGRDSGDSGPDADDTGPAPDCTPTDERCDGADNDCDGAIDEAPVDGATFYTDGDGDGHGAPGSTVVACEAPAGTAAEATDCDDADGAIHPDAVETCDGVDEDCDGTVDDVDGEDCTAAPPAVPAALLDLAPWKITLPVGEEGSPQEVTQPELDSFSVDPYFHVAESGDVVVFRAHAGGTTTSGSSYPRSELREMTADGAERASWSTTSGVHTMTITQAITHLPEVKAHAVAGQIHDAEDDVVMIRLEERYLYVEGGGEDLGVLDPDYTLGDEFTVRITAADGWIEVYYEDMATPAVRVERDTSGCYFKAGVYTQSNTERGDAPDAYAQVEMRDLRVTHE